MANYLKSILPLFMIIMFANGKSDSRSITADNVTFAVVANINLDHYDDRSITLVKMINSTKDLDFVIINGDINHNDGMYSKLEIWSGKSYWNDFFEIYNKLNKTLFIGLGDKDYELSVNRCWQSNKPEYVGLDGCAMESISVIEDMIKKMKGFLTRWQSSFEADYISPEYRQEEILKGSLAYSWDDYAWMLPREYKYVHFVQLHNYPTYSVQLKNGSRIFYDITRSLSWLANDLNMARKNGTKDIIINFHNYEGFAKQSSHNDRLLFRALMETYKPRAVFVAKLVYDIYSDDDNNFTTLHDESLFGNITIYVTGAAFQRYFHLVHFNVTGHLVIQEMKVIYEFVPSPYGGKYESKLVQLGEYKQEPQVYTPTCREYFDSSSLKVEAGSIFATRLNLDERQCRLYNSHSKKYLATDGYGHIFMSDGDAKHVIFRWKSLTLNKKYYPEFWSDFVLYDPISRRFLASDNYGNLYTKRSFPTWDDYDSGDWKVKKTQDYEIMIISLKTKRSLSVTQNNKVHANSGIDVDNPNQSWQIIDAEKPEAIGNVRYFKALVDNATQWPLPDGSKSNEQWEFLGYHNIRSPAPCVGWM